MPVDSNSVSASVRIASISGTINNAVGEYALKSNTTANNNTAVGYSTLKGITSGVENTAMGFQAGQTIKSGQNNVLIGKNAMASAIGAGGASNNVAVGVDASKNSPDSVGNNVAVGYQTLQESRSIETTAVGARALQNCGKAPGGLGTGCSALG